MRRAADAEPSRGARGATPRSVLVMGLACLVAAGAVSWFSGDAVDRYSGLVWILAIVPVFLFSYHRGWRGAAVAMAAAMIVLVAVELVVRIGAGSDPGMLRLVAPILIPIASGIALLAELLHRQKRMALMLAFQDPVTGLPNRRLLGEHGEKAILAAARDGSKVALIYLDLVRFKAVNARYGHEAGDRALKRIAERLRNRFRDSDTVGRIGGDEFVIILPGIAVIEDAVTATERAREVLERAFRIGGENVRLRARFGIAVYPDHAESLDELLSRADPAEAGRGQPDTAEIVVYDPASAPSPQSIVISEHELVRAIDSDGLEFHYQPVVEMKTGAIVGAEALARLAHPEHGLMNAGDFLEQVQHAGLMSVLDRLAITSAARQAARWQAEGGPSWVAVNVAPSSLAGGAILPLLEECLTDDELGARHLVLEIAERAAVRNPKEVGQVLREMRAMGIRVALDDFGTGQASLVSLGCMAADFLKLDIHYVRTLGMDPRQGRLVEGVIGLAHGLGMTVIAEGVETRMQAHWLKERGCDLAQGFWMGAPTSLHAWVSAVEVAS